MRKNTLINIAIAVVIVLFIVYTWGVLKLSHECDLKGGKLVKGYWAPVCVQAK